MYWSDFFRWVALFVDARKGRGTGSFLALT